MGDSKFFINIPFTHNEVLHKCHPKKTVSEDNHVKRFIFLTGIIQLIFMSDRELKQ